MSATRYTHVSADRCGVSPRSADWCRRMFVGGLLDDLGINCGVESKSTSDFSVPVFRASQATKTRKVFWNLDENGSFRLKRGTAVPWSDKFKPAGGTDHHLVILDDTGPGGSIVGEWDFWEWATNGDVRSLFNSANLAAGYKPGIHATAGAAHYFPVGLGNDGPFVIAPLTDGLVFPEEVKAGYIGHVVRLIVGAQSSMSGFEAPPGMDPDDPAIGVRFGCAASPCPQYESREVATTYQQLALMVPDGARFRLVITKAEAERRLREGGASGVLLDSLLVVACALIDFGVIVGRTSKLKPALDFDGSRPAEWKALGFTSSSVADTSLHGLIRGPEDIACCAFATSTLADGSTTRRSGPAVSVGYP